MRRAAAAADGAVQALAAGRPEARGAATTLTAVAVARDAVVVAHAGDSRAYLVGGAGAVQLTVDHTLVQEHPEMAPDEAGALRHVITRFLGQPGGCPFDVSTHALPPGAGLVLCTDGVTNVVPPQRLAGVVRPGEGEGVAGGAERVVALVEALDGADDATIVVAWPATTIGAAGVPGAAEGTAGDPFRLRRLLERERPGRRGRLTRGALLALLGAAGVGAAWYWVGPRLEEAVRRPFRPPPDAAAREYLQAWSAGDLGALYRRLTPEAQRTYSEEAFTALHRQVGAEMTLQSLQLTIRPGEAAGSGGSDGGGADGVPFEAAYTTARFGALRRENVLPLAWREGEWRVAWTPAVLLPDLAGGRTLRAFGDDAARGALLDAAGRPLATGSGRVRPGASGAGRQYPQGSLAGPLTGYVGEITSEELAARAGGDALPGDLVGKAGLESIAETLLAGQRGGRLTVLAPSGEIANTLSSTPARPGETVRLTLDLDLQRECEAALGERRGSVLVLDVREGAVLAMASAPGYDPNVFVAGGDVGAILNDAGQPLLNRPLQGLYPPGSIFKAVTMAAGLEQGAFRPDSQFTCSGRWTGLPGLTFDCWLSGGHGRLDLVSGLTRSCNSVFYEVGKRLDEIDPNFLPEFALRSGFGGATGAVPAQEPGRDGALSAVEAPGPERRLGQGRRGQHGHRAGQPAGDAPAGGGPLRGYRRRGPAAGATTPRPGAAAGGQRGAPPDSPGQAAPAVEGADAGGGAGRAAGGRRGAGRDGRRGLPGIAPGRLDGRQDGDGGDGAGAGAPRLVRLLRPAGESPRWWCWRCWSTPAKARRWRPRWPGGCSKSPCGATLPLPA